METSTLFAVLLGLFTLVWLLVVLDRARSRERLHCPDRNADFDVELDRRLRWNWAPGKAIRVVACSAFANPSQVACDRRCLKT